MRAILAEALCPLMFKVKVKVFLQLPYISCIGFLGYFPRDLSLRTVSQCGLTPGMNG